MGCGTSSAVASDRSFTDFKRSTPRHGFSWNDSYYQYSRNSRPFQNRNFPDGDPNKGALKRQIRNHLAATVSKGTLKELEEALRLWEQHGVQQDNEYYKAIRKVEYLRIKESLRDAVRRRHAGTLDKVIQVARASPYALQLASAISAADKLRAQLMQWGVHRHAPLDLEQATVSEIRSFKAPPPCVVTVMAAVHRLLGYRRSEIETWQKMQTLMGLSGEHGLLYKVRHFQPASPSVEAAQDARDMLNDVSHDEILMASNGAARFYIWATSMMTKVCGQVHKNKAKKKKKANVKWR